jgi:hypothetical protein
LGKAFRQLTCLVKTAARAGNMECRVPASANSSRTIEFDGFNLAAVAMHVKGDRTTTNFAILNGGKCTGRGVNDRGEDRSAVGTNNA